MKKTENVIQVSISVADTCEDFLGDLFRLFIHSFIVIKLIYFNALPG